MPQTVPAKYAPPTVAAPKSTLTKKKKGQAQDCTLLFIALLTIGIAVIMTQGKLLIFIGAALLARQIYKSKNFMIKSALVCLGVIVVASFFAPMYSNVIGRF